MNFNSPFPTTAARADWDAMTAKITAGTVIPTQGVLRIEADALAGSTGITFDLSPQTGAMTATEIRLNTNDAFMCTGIGLFLGVRATGANASAAKLLSFPNDKVFGADGTASNDAARAFWNGVFSVRRDSTILIDQLDVLSCMRADTAQSGVAVSAVATTGVVGADFWAQESAFKGLTPNILFNGSGKNVISVDLRENSTFTLAGKVVSAVCILRGWKLQNGGTLRSSI
jgi:hypothetical protein